MSTHHSKADQKSIDKTITQASKDICYDDICVKSEATVSELDYPEEPQLELEEPNTGISLLCLCYYSSIFKKDNPVWEYEWRLQPQIDCCKQGWFTSFID